MESLTDILLFELELLAERLHLGVTTVQRRLGLRPYKMNAIRNHLAPMSDVKEYYEKVLTQKLVYDALDRFNVAFDFIMKRYSFRRRNDVAVRMDISGWRFRRIFEGNTQFFNELFLQDFNETFDDIFDLDWIMYGEGLMFKDEYLLIKKYGLKSAKAVEEAKRRATISNMKTYDYDKYYDTFRRKVLVKKAMNPEDNKIIFSTIRELSKEIVESKNAIERYENTIKEYQQEIRYKKMEIAKMKQKIQQRRDYMVGRAFLDMYNDIENL